MTSRLGITSSDLCVQCRLAHRRWLVLRWKDSREGLFHRRGSVWCRGSRVRERLYRRLDERWGRDWAMDCFIPSFLTTLRSAPFLSICRNRLPWSSRAAKAPWIPIYCYSLPAHFFTFPVTSSLAFASSPNSTGRAPPVTCTYWFLLWYQPHAYRLISCYSSYTTSSFPIIRWSPVFSPPLS